MGSTGIGMIRRLWGMRWTRIAFAVSVAVNLFFAVRYVLFEPNVLVRPLCWTNHQGLIALDGPQTRRYRDTFNISGGPYDVRLDREGYSYVSQLTYWTEEDYFWNITTKAVNQLVIEHGDTMTLPPYKQEGPDRVKVTCELVQAVAIQPPTDQ
ncbi:MAG: hypothetical protein AB7P12_15010 [Alphaproteobacteria bacterium]